MGHISPGGENLLDFLELQQELSTYDLDLRDPLCWPHERPVPMQVARGTLHRKQERNSSVVPPFPESHRCLSPFQGNLFSLHCLDFEAEDRHTPRWHVGQPCGKASWESLEGKPQIRSSTRMEARHCCYSSGGKRKCMTPLETRTDSPGETPEVAQDQCQHWRGILTFQHRLQARS